jgi:signal transduction histidine kinase/HAMP domain-containing protein
VQEGTGKQEPGRFTIRLSFSSLRARLLLLLCLALLPAYGFILFSALESRQQAADHARENARWLIRLLGQEQRDLVESARQLLLSLAQLPIVRRPEWSALCSRTFADVRAKNINYANLGVIDADGTLRCSALPLAGRVDLSDRDYFREAMRTQSFAIGDYQIGRVSGNGSTNIAYPVLDTAGHPLAVVFIALDVGALANRLVETAALTEGSTLTILNSRGMILARHPEPEKWVGKKLPNAAVLRAILDGRGGDTLEGAGVDGVERLYTFAPFYSTAANSVYVSAGIPTDAVYAEANSRLMRAAVLMILITGAAIVLARMGSQALVLKPAAALMSAARRLGQGELAARTGLPHTADEFGQLAQTFDQMAASLEQKNELLTVMGAMAKVGGWEFDARTGKGTWTDEVARIHDVDSTDETDVAKGLTFYQGEHRERIEAAVRDAIEHARPYDLELEMVTPKGNRKWVRTIGQPVLEAGKVVKVWGSFQDITEHKRDAEEIRRLNTDLERRVAERTAQLEAANKELEAFSYSVSHDLRAPLRAVDGYAQILEEEQAARLDADGWRVLGVIRDSARQMGQLIDDLLAFSRLGRKTLTPGEVDMQALVQEVLGELCALNETRWPEIALGALPRARADRALLRQVWANLLANAVKFSAAADRPHIEVGALTDGGEHVFYVRDNGAGFDMRYADKLFGVFQRLHSADEFPGTGVGLAIVKRVVARHGGRVWAEGQPHAGATFYFTLPATQGATHG